VAKVLNSISLDAPAAPVTADVNDTFDFTGTPGFAGGGGVQRYDWKWEVDDGGGFVTIGASGTGLITADTNPLVNSNSQTANSITVTCDQAGSYTIRMAGAPTTGGSYTVFSATQTVEVSEPEGTTFQQAIAATAVGTATVSPLSTYLRTLAATAVGSAALTSASVIGKTLETAAVVVATLATALLTTVEMAATAVGSAALARVTTFSRTLAATAVGTATLTKKMFVTLAATATGAVGFVKGMFKTIAATATAAPTLDAAVLALVNMAATAVGSAVLSAASLITQAISAVATGVASLATQFIAGGGAGVAAGFKRMRGFMANVGRMMNR